MLFLFLATLSFGQERKSTFKRKYNPKPNIEINPLPVFPGEISEYIKENIRYPEKAYENKIDGIVIISYAVQADGFVGKVIVLQGIGYGCDEEAIRVLENMPQWTPGQQNGKNVNTYYTLRIDFNYPDEDLTLLPDRKATFPGNLGKFLRNNFKFPYTATVYETRGEVLVTFIINEYGYVTNIEFLMNVRPDIDEAVRRLIRKMPRWSPAVRDGQRVPSRFSITMDF